MYHISENMLLYVFSCPEGDHVSSRQIITGYYDEMKYLEFRLFSMVMYTNCTTFCTLCVYYICERDISIELLKKYNDILLILP